MNWLQQHTNRTEAYWMARVQALIAENSTEPQENGHSMVDLNWVHQLINEIIKTLPPIESGVSYDGNMRVAAIASGILGLWFAQTLFAKTQDPARPTFTRQVAYDKRLAWCEWFVRNVLLDSSQGPTYFPGQKWGNPFSPDSKSGDFI